MLSAFLFHSIPLDALDIYLGRTSQTLVPLHPDYSVSHAGAGLGCVKIEVQLPLVDTGILPDSHNDLPYFGEFIYGGGLCYDVHDLSADSSLVHNRNSLYLLFRRSDKHIALVRKHLAYAEFALVNTLAAADAFVVVENQLL